jgi:CheY-like chemotaxis protein
LIANTSELMSVSMGERITVELKADDDLWLCKVDQMQLQNAILNLSINARDAMPSGGDVTISAENAPLDAERAEALELDAGDYVCLSVSDNGPGIPADVLEHVFEPFFTTKDVGEGSGLGLSMVYGFVRQSGASVDIEVGESGGTAVKLYFPAFVPDEPEAAGSGTNVQDQVTEPDATILLVEDNAAFREITRAILESLNFRVIDCGTAEEALAVIGDTTPINLLLSDIGLPGDMDGHDLAQFAASARPGLKTVLMSAHTDREFSDGIIDGNVAAFLRKPHRKADLTQTLHRVLGLDS